MNRRHLLCLGLLVAVLVAAGCSAPATPEPAADTPAPRPTATTATAPTAAATSAPIQGDLPVGLTEYGAPYRGDPSAPVTLLEYSDFL